MKAKVAELRKEFQYILNCRLPALKNAIKDEITEAASLEPKVNRGSLLVDITFRQESETISSDLFRMIEDGSLLQRLEAATFTEELQQSFADISGIRVASDAEREQLKAVLRDLAAGLSVRLSVELHKTVDLLFSPQCQTITLTLSPMEYRPAAVSVSDVFDEAFPALSEILVKPRSQSMVSPENGM